MRARHLLSSARLNIGTRAHDAARGSPADASTHAPFTKALVVANPIAGNGRARGAAREMSEGLVRRGIASELFFTSSRGDARLKLRGLDASVDLVVAVGGDGTVSEVLDGLVNREVPVAILPFGTANVMSLDLGLPRDVDRALEVIAGRRTTRLDVARVNGKHLSFLVTGVGLDAMVVRELERARTGPITKLAWGRAAARTLFSYSPPVLTVELDAERLPGDFGFVLVSNIVHYAGFKVLASDRNLDDGLFEVYLFRKSSKAGLIGYAVRGLVSGFPGGSCRMRRARRVKITSPVPVPYHVDGDFRGETPVEIAVSDAQFQLVIP